MRSTSSAHSTLYLVCLILMTMQAHRDPAVGEDTLGEGGCPAHAPRAGSHGPGTRIQLYLASLLTGAHFLLHLSFPCRCPLHQVRSAVGRSVPPGWHCCSVCSRQTLGVSYASPSVSELGEMGGWGGGEGSWYLLT